MTDPPDYFRVFKDMGARIQNEDISNVLRRFPSIFLLDCCISPHDRLFRDSGNLAESGWSAKGRDPVPPINRVCFDLFSSQTSNSSSNGNPACR